MIDSEGKREREEAWFSLIHAVLAAARPQPVICACVEEDVELIHPALARVHVTHRPCVCVCSAGAPSFKQEIVSHCSLSIKNQLPLLNECHGQSTEDVQERRVSRPREFDSF